MVLDGRVVLITGATDGLGRALAREVLDAGATVLVHGRSAERIAGTVAELDGGERVRAYRADLASLAAVHGLADELLAGEERIDVLVNNAGIGARTGRVEEREVSEDGYELRFAVNYLAGFALTQRVLPIVAERMTGRFFDGLREAEPDRQAADAEARRRLWDLSERLTARRGG
jgi:NAD(P)-dependent dehydrogenase (short-subunit alcohol dehydrogenase family)